MPNDAMLLANQRDVRAEKIKGSVGGGIKWWLLPTQKARIFLHAKSHDIPRSIWVFMVAC
jgi:hypothetical protein